MADLLAFLMDHAASQTAFGGGCGRRNIHKNVHGLGAQGRPFAQSQRPKRKRTTPQWGCMETALWCPRGSGRGGVRDRVQRCLARSPPRCAGAAALLDTERGPHAGCNYGGFSRHPTQVLVRALCEGFSGTIRAPLNGPWRKTPPVPTGCTAPHRSNLVANPSRGGCDA
jgi:hypothetical protein